MPLSEEEQIAVRERELELRDASSSGDYITGTKRFAGLPLEAARFYAGGNLNPTFEDALRLVGNLTTGLADIPFHPLEAVKGLGQGIVTSGRALASAGTFQGLPPDIMAKMEQRPFTGTVEALTIPALIAGAKGFRSMKVEPSIGALESRIDAAVAKAEMTGKPLTKEIPSLQPIKTSSIFRERNEAELNGIKPETGTPKPEAVFKAPSDKLIFGELPPKGVQPKQISDLMGRSLEIPVNAAQIGRFYESNQLQAHTLGDFMGQTYKGIIPKSYKDVGFRERLFKDYQASEGIYDLTLERKYGKSAILPLEYHNEMINGFAQKAQQFGILDDLVSNYFTQRWTGPKDLIGRIDDFVPEIVNRTFQRNKGRIFDDIQAGLDYFKEQAQKTGDSRWLQIKPVTDLEALDRLYLREFARSASLRAMAEQMLKTPLSKDNPLNMAVRMDKNQPSNYVKMSGRSFGPDFYVHESLKPNLDDMISVGDQGRIARGFYGTSYLLKRLALLTDFIVHPINVASRAFGPFLEGLATPKIGSRLGAFSRGTKLNINSLSDFIEAGGEPIGNMRRGLDLQRLTEPIFNEELTGWKKTAKQTGHFLDNIVSFPGNTMFKGIEHFQLGVYALKKSEFLSKGMTEAEASQRAAMVANQVTGAFPSSVISKAMRAAWRGILMSPTWTRSQLDVWGQAVGKSPLLKGVPDAVRKGAIHDSRVSLAAGLASSMIGLELLNYYLNGDFTWDKSHGGADYLFSVQTGKDKNGRAQYMHWPVGFFLTQLLGYGIHDIPQAIQGATHPSQAKGLADYRVFGKVNPFIRDVYGLLKGDYERVARGLLPIGISGEASFPAESKPINWLLAVAGAGRYPGRKGGYVGDLSRKELFEKQAADKEVSDKVGEYLASGDARKLNQYLNTLERPNSISAKTRNLAKLRDREQLGKTITNAQNPVTNLWKMMGKEQAKIRFMAMNQENRRLVWQALLKEGTDPVGVFGDTP